MTNTQPLIPQHEERMEHETWAPRGNNFTEIKSTVNILRTTQNSPHVPIHVLFFLTFVPLNNAIFLRLILFSATESRPKVWRGFYWWMLRFCEWTGFNDLFCVHRNYKYIFLSRNFFIWRAGAATPLTYQLMICGFKRENSGTKHTLF